MNLNNIYFISVGIIVFGVAIIIILSLAKNYKKNTEDIKKRIKKVKKLDYKSRRKNDESKKTTLREELADVLYKYDKEYDLYPDTHIPKLNNIEEAFNYIESKLELYRVKSLLEDDRKYIWDKVISNYQYLHYEQIIYNVVNDKVGMAYHELCDFIYNLNRGPVTISERIYISFAVKLIREKIDRMHQDLVGKYD